MCGVNFVSSELEDTYVFGQAVISLIWVVENHNLSKREATRILSALIGAMLNRGWLGALGCLKRFNHHDFVREAFAQYGYTMYAGDICVR